jgi:hypothetical protein
MLGDSPRSAALGQHLLTTLNQRGSRSAASMFPSATVETKGC